MKVIILAAGKGTRLGTLTEDNPKSMILIERKPLLEHILENLPSEIDSIILAIGHHGEKIKEYFGNQFKGKPITYFETQELNGTAGTLFQAQSLLQNRFLVLYGDDLHTKNDIADLLKYPLAIGVFKGKINHKKYWQTEIDENGILCGLRPATPEETKNGITIVTGAFVLDKKIFNENPVKLTNGEYGLPQTILNLAKKSSVKTVIMQSWQTITYPEDIIDIKLGA